MIDNQMIMLNQRRTLYIIFFLVHCIIISEQLFIGKKNPIVWAVDEFKERTNDLLNLKNSITNETRTQIILNLNIDVFDPEWLSKVSYAHWYLQGELALKSENTTEWAHMIGKVFNIEMVLEEIKSSTASRISCLACKFLVNMVRYMVLSGKSDEEILLFTGKHCGILEIQTPRVCDGVMNLIGIDVVEIIKLSNMTSAQICSFVLDNSCLNGYDERHNWKVDVPPAQVPLMNPEVVPESGAPFLKVLQVSDIHYDPYYQEGANADCNEPLCCRSSDGLAKSYATAAGKWGDYRKCDTPTRLLINALKHISDTHKDIDYILWTGDHPPHDIWNQTREENLKNLRITSELMAKYFKDIPIFPSIGNHESCPVDSYAPPFAPMRKNMSWLYDELNNEWSRWLPSDTAETIKRGAYYSSLVKPGFRIIALNGNYCNRNNFWLLLNSTDPVDQLSWLIRELSAAEVNGEKVHIVGHIPPGQPDCLKTWSKNYYDIINRFEGTVMAQFYGHTHYDEFEVFYDTKDFDRAINVGYIAPSITPWENVNPGYRIYYVDGDHPQTTRSIIDHETWAMNLDDANLNDNPIWYKSYSAKEEYSMTSLLPKDWNNLISRMQNDKSLFEKYHRNYYRNSSVRPECNNECQRYLLCNLRSGRSYDKHNLCRTV